MTVEEHFCKHCGKTTAHLVRPTHHVVYVTCITCRTITERLPAKVS